MPQGFGSHLVSHLLMKCVAIDLLVHVHIEVRATDTPI